MSNFHEPPLSLPSRLQIQPASSYYSGGETPETPTDASYKTALPSRNSVIGLIGRAPSVSDTMAHVACPEDGAYQDTFDGAGSLPEFDNLAGQEADDIYFSQTQQAHSQRPSQTSKQDTNVIWAALVPANPNCGLPRFDLRRDHDSNTYTFGRNPKLVDFTLSFKKVSSLHCRIKFVEESGQSSSSSMVMAPFVNGHVLIEDLSSNGTYLDSQKIGRGKKTILESGNEICFGPPSTESNEDLRFIFRRIHNQADEQADPSLGGGLHELYDVRDKIGKGSFATVKRAICRRTGEMKAVKIMQKARFMSNQKTWMMLQREVEIMKALDHPHIVKYEAYFEDAQMLYIVMDFINGGDLLDFTIRRNGVDEAEGAEIARQICLAVAYLHSQGVCHRDLKPDNILITAGETPLIKVSDFGLAKMVDAATFLKTACGTPSYLAPEVVLNRSSSGYSFAVDAWSIGVIVYAILTNSSPFDEDEAEPLDKRMRFNRSPDVEQLHEKGISDEGIDFMVRLMAYKPAERLSVGDALKHLWLMAAQRNQLSSGSLSMLPPNVTRGAHRLQTTPSLAHTSASARSHRSISVASPQAQNDSDGEGYSQKMRHMAIASPLLSKFGGHANGFAQHDRLEGTMGVESERLPSIEPRVRNGNIPHGLKQAADVLVDDSQDEENESPPFGIDQTPISRLPRSHSEESADARQYPNGETGSIDLRTSTKRKTPPSSAFSSSSSLSELSTSSDSLNNQMDEDDKTDEEMPVSKRNRSTPQRSNKSKGPSHLNGSEIRRQSSRIAKQARRE